MTREKAAMMVCTWISQTVQLFCNDVTKSSQVVVCLALRKL